MTGFASGRGQQDAYSWSWDLRAVNARGLDLRLRVPDWVGGLEQSLRKKLAARLGRGSVTLSLRLVREEGAERLHLNETQLSLVMSSLSRIQTMAAAADLDLAPVTAADLLGQRGVQEQLASEEDTESVAKLLRSDFDDLLEEFCEMRAAEGRALSKIVLAQVQRIGELVASAAGVAEARRDRVTEALRANLARILDNTDGVDEYRLAQEIALLSVKTDVTEEIDR
ncbi:MAG: YicC/YloC family endoribonuclease, partial [Halocynthiibacter sp.]